MNVTMVYVAAPFSAPDRAGVEANIRSAEALGIEVAKLGAFPVVPHANTSHPDYERVQPYAFWIAGTMALLRACDCVLMHPDWQRSSGARGEHADAVARSQPVFYALAELAAWLSERRRLGV